MTEHETSNSNFIVSYIYNYPNTLAFWYLSTMSLSYFPNSMVEYDWKTYAQTKGKVIPEFEKSKKKFWDTSLLSTGQFL